MEGVTELKENARSLTVLYVEDDGRLREDTVRLLSKFFVRIDSACDGVEGLTKYKSGLYDIIITDIRMPRMNGVELVKHIKEIDKDQNIIIISAHDETHYLLELINLNINNFVLKPLDVQNFLFVLNRLCKKIRSYRELDEFHRDLEKKVMEETEKRRRSEQLMLHQSKLASMGEIIVAIAHQWKQPLNAVSLIVQDIKDAFKHGELTSQYVDDSVSKAMKQVEYMANTIDSFRTFLKPSKTKVSFDLQSSLGEVVHMFSNLFAKSTISLSLQNHTNPEEPLMATGYPNEFKHVVLNIINNARDAILSRRAQDSAIPVNMGEIVIRVERDADGKVSVTIADNGGGIAPEILGRVFDPYFTTKGEEEGTGIGLYMSKTIIEDNMEGTLSVRNTGKGAEFTIKL